MRIAKLPTSLPVPLLVAGGLLNQQYRMKYILIIGLAALTSCSVSRKAVSTETIRYAAYKCDCRYPDGFGMDRKIVNCDSGTALIRSSEVIKRSPRTIKVQVGHCLYTYLLIH